jgi:uncharacterized MAPEG superfamily protein
MTIAYWCVLAMIIYPYIFTVIAKWNNRYDNHNPREYLKNTTGWRWRANCVQMNSFEALPAFGIAVIIATLAHAPQARIDLLAVIFVIARIIYGICYLADKSSLRTLIWFVGLVSVLLLMLAGATS